MATDEQGLVPDENLEDISVAPGKPEADQGDRRDKPEDKEDKLEKGLEDSMDGSDVPSVVQP